MFVIDNALFDHAIFSGSAPSDKDIRLITVVSCESTFLTEAGARIFIVYQLYLMDFEFYHDLIERCNLFYYVLNL